MPCKIGTMKVQSENDWVDEEIDLIKLTYLII